MYQLSKYGGILMEQQLLDIMVTPLGIKNIRLLGNENKVGYFYDVKLLKLAKSSFKHHVILVDPLFGRREESEAFKQALKFMLNQMKKVKNHSISILAFGASDTDVWIVQDIKSEEIALRQEELESRIDHLLSRDYESRISSLFKKGVDWIEQNQAFYQQNHLVLLTQAQWDSLDYSLEDEITQCLESVSQEVPLFFQFDILLLNNPLQFHPLQRLIHLASGGMIYDVRTRSQLLRLLKQCLVKNSRLIINENAHLFLVQEHRFYEENEFIEISSIKSNVWVVFDKPLVIDQCKFESVMSELEQSLFRKFQLSYSICLLRQRKVESAIYQLAQTGQEQLYYQVLNGYSGIELVQSLKLLNRAYEAAVTKPLKESFDNREILPQVESLCLLELLQYIIQDEGSNLWWEYEQHTQLIATKDERYQFKRYANEFGKVTHLQVGSKKINIGLKVKVRGQVEDISTGLKIDAHIFRTIPLMVNGQIIMKELLCTLSKSLKKLVKEAKLVKRQWIYQDHEIIVLNLEKLKVTNHRMSVNMTDQDVAASLYKIQQLACQRYVLKRLIHECLSLQPSSRELKNSEQLKRLRIRRQYGISESGLFLPLTTYGTEHQSNEMYPVSIIEWKVEGFLNKIEQQKAYEKYMYELNYQPSSPINWLFNELEKVSVEHQVLVDQVNLKRISTYLRRESFFNWDYQFESKKVQMDGIMKRNVVQGGKMKVSIKKIDQVTIRENAYTVWIKCT